MAGSTGDMKNNLMKLLREIRRMKLQIEPNIQGLTLGSPSSFLPLLHASLMHYSLPFANWLTKHSYDLYSKSDLRFLQELYRVLRDVFHYKPKLTKEQFLSNGFAERKVLFTTQVLLLCQAKHYELTSKRDRNSRKFIYRHGNSKLPDVLTIQDRSGVGELYDIMGGRCGLHASGPTVVAMGTQDHILYTPPPSPPHPLPPPTSSTPTRLSPDKDLHLTPSFSPALNRVQCEMRPPPLVIRHGTPTQTHPIPESEGGGDSKEDGGSSGSGTPLDSWAGLPPDNRDQGEIEEISSRIEQLTKLVERMTAKFVLLETQMKISQKEERVQETQESEHHQEKSKPNEAITIPHQHPSPLKHTALQSDSPHPLPHPLHPLQSNGTQLTSKTALSHHSSSPRASLYNSPLSIHCTPTTPAETRRLIESLRERAQRTKEFLQLANTHQVM